MEDTTMFNIRLTGFQKAKLATIAKIEHRTMTGVILYWLDNYPGVTVDTLPHQGAPDGVDIPRVTVYQERPE